MHKERWHRFLSGLFRLRFLPILFLPALVYSLALRTTVNDLLSYAEIGKAESEISIPTLESHTHTPRLVTYVQTFITPGYDLLSLLPLIKHDTKVTHVILASLHLNKVPGDITLNDNPLYAPMYDGIWREVKTLQQNGVKVMALLGGAAPGTFEKLNGTDEEFNAHYQPLLKLIKDYGFDGLDIDIEQEIDISVPLRLLRSLHRDMGPSFILTLTPLAAALSAEDGQNISNFSYFKLDKLAIVPGTNTKLISWYNAMFYGGFANSANFYKSCVQAGWDPSRIVMGVLDNENDGALNGFTNLTTLEGTIKDLKQMYSGFGGVAGWEYHDAGATDGLTEPWEWVKRIGAALFEP